MADNSMALVCANYADPSSKLNAGRSYVVFGKQDNTDAINLSAIAAWRLSNHSNHLLTRH
jgi:NAD(P)H-hydrate repair Nnr-like enzyme with NAD(P)H-hydrate dehydratase domain